MRGELPSVGFVRTITGSTHRVPGLRREELAQLAGVSATYYTRLEQGQSAHASAAVIDALNLTDDERIHLHDLARPTRTKPRRQPKPATARRGTVQLINAIKDVPAVVPGLRNEVLAWNALGHLLLAGHVDFEAPTRPADRPNLTRMLFLDPHHKEMHLNWETEATRAVSALRLVAGKHADDQELAALVGELTMKSPAFATRWSKHPVANCIEGTKHFQHPLVGKLTLNFEALLLPEDKGKRILMYSAPPDSPSEAALQLLRRQTNRSGPQTTKEQNRRQTRTVLQDDQRRQLA
jgi:transcriptional regulator with XRE-family HTH domain